MSRAESMAARINDDAGFAESHFEKRQLKPEPLIKSMGKTMTINATPLDQADFETRLAKFMEQFEGRRYLPYLDTAIPALPTIGIGFNLTQKTVRDAVFREMGITLGSAMDSALTKAVTDSVGTTDAELRAAMDAAYGQQFIMTDAQIDATFQTKAKSYVDAARSASGIGYCDELVALTSAAFNGLLGPNLQTALQLGDPHEARAEAWYQIRYVHKDQLHKRRYAEAALFGLYDDAFGTSGIDEALAIYKMYSRHGREILTQTGKDLIGYDKAFGGFMSGANEDLAKAGFSGVVVRSLGDELRLAAIALESHFVVNRGIGFPGGFNPLNIQVALSDGSSTVGEDNNTRTGSSSDLLIGGSGGDSISGRAGNDVLSGGAGADNLDGGAGDDKLDGADAVGGDTLEGGSGFDTYYADDGDIIHDSDGQGEVWLNGKKLTIATRKKGETAYKDAAGNIYIQVGSTLQINDPLIIENFSSGDFGIELKEELDDDDPDEQPLEDPFEDAEETKSPLVLDLDGNGIATRGIGEGAFFDYDGNGFAERTGWVSPSDGLLVRDLDKNGTIESGMELFGDRTRLASGKIAADGFEALADLDGNGDGRFDAKDIGWADVSVWQDKDSDGITDAGELKSLDELGIESVSIAHTAIATIDAHENQHLQRGSFHKNDGSNGLVEDIWFRVNTSSTRQVNPLFLSPAIRSMPEVRGSGNVASLRQAMAMDSTGRLKELVDDFIANTDILTRSTLITNLIYVWAGVEDKDPTSRAASMIYGNAIGDARKLYAMEAFLGRGYEGTWCWNEKDPNPHGPAAAVLLKAFDEFSNGVAAQILAQSQFKEYYDSLIFTWDSDGENVKADLSNTVSLIREKLTARREQGMAELVSFITNLTYTFDTSLFDTRAFQESLAELGQDVVNAAGMAWRGMVVTQGNDRLTGDDSNEVISAWAGNDIVYGGGGSDRLLGEDGNDALFGENGDDILVGDSGNDLLDGGAGNDIYLFGRGSGQDTIQSQDSAAGKVDVLKLSGSILPADISALRNIDDLILSILDTGDRLTVAGYFVNDGMSGASLQRIELENGTVWDFAAIKAMLPSRGTENADQIRGYNTSEAIDGLSGNDVIDGRGGDDTIVGGIGNDSVFGGAENDTLEGGIDNDTLNGETGNDVYLFKRGDGTDVIYDYDWTSGNVDTVRFGDGIASADVVVSRDQSSLYMSIKGTSDRLTLQNWFAGDAYKVERVEFADGTVWGVTELIAASLVATDGPDSLIGTSGNEVISGLGGNDTLVGGAGNDTLDGGVGNDTLNGEAGNDVYLFKWGDGTEVISDYDWTSGNIDTVRFGDGIATADVVVRRDQSNLYISIKGTSDRLTLQHWFAGDAYKVERVEFADGTVWGVTELIEASLVATDGPDSLIGTSGNEVISGLGGNDTLVGGGGNDTLQGGTGIDSLDGGTGDDTYLFSRGDGLDRLLDYDATTGNIDTVRFAAGIAPSDVQVTRDQNHIYLSIRNTTDQLILQNWFGGDASKIERIAFADGTVWTVTDPSLITGTEADDRLIGTSAAEKLAGLGGNDVLQGEGGNDTLSGGTGKDTLQGGIGDDLYLFRRGDGAEEVYDTGSAIGDVLRFDTSVAPDDVTVSRDAFTIRLRVNGTDDQVALMNWFASNANKIERIEFANGIAWGESTLMEKLSVPTEGDDYLIGTQGDDALAGLGGADLLTAGWGNDTLDGGTGNDKLYGGGGNDTYLYRRSDGADTIVDEGGNDTLRFDAGVSPADIYLSRDYDHLYLNFRDSNERITLQYWFLSERKIEQVEFADGTVWGEAELLAGSRNATDNADYLTGTSGNDSIAGMGGNDRIETEAGNDTLDGGAGSDYLNGGSGNDLYLFARGDGGDSVTDDDATFGNVDTLRFAAGIAPGDIAVTGDQYNLFLSIKGTSDRVQLQGWLSSDTLKVERVEFADGTVWRMQDLITASQQPSDGPDNIAGTAGNDKLSGAGGDDTILGGNGDDSINGGSGHDVLYGDDYFGGAGFGGVISGIDVLYGEDGNDYLNGGGKDDTLDGGNGNDTLAGGSGADMLRGGVGADTYYFNSGDGVDTIDDHDDASAPTDVLRFGDGLVASSVEVSRRQQDLVLSVQAGTDKIVIKSWFASDADKIERFEFADDTVWTADDIAALLPDVVPGVHLTGKGGKDTLVGGLGDDTLDGGAGQDGMYGGKGNDTYIVSAKKDVVVELAGEGSDTVYSRVDYVLPDQVEYLVLTGNASVDGTGNALDNALTGNAKKNALDGGPGADTLSGGAGDDTYHVDDAGDVIVEQADEGSDLVMASVDHALAEDVERLILIGKTAFIARGNALDNELTGNANGNLLEGLAGNDTLVGDAGEDVLRGGDGRDVLKDKAGSNLFDGGDGDDTLSGGSGHELFVGGRGNDTVDAGRGRDIIAFNRGDGQDTVLASKGPDNTVSLGGGIRYEDMMLRKSGDNLILDLGADDRLTFKNWYGGNANASARTLQVIVDAMDDYAPGSADSLRNRRINRFDFAGLVGQFDKARAKSPKLTQWALMTGLLDMHLAGSDDAALGGDLAYQYGKAGALSSLSLASTQSVLADPLFASQPQALRPSVPEQTPEPF